MPNMLTPPICACGCGEALPPPPRTGRPRRYLNDAHKHRAKRERAGAGSWGGPAAAPSIPTDPETRHRRTLLALADELAGRPPGPPEDQLQQILIELTQALFTLRQIAARLHPKLGARARQLADDLAAAVRRSFGEVL